MLYQRAFSIERRLAETLKLIRTGKHSTPALAKALGVSIPTVSRCIQALRERGHAIRAERHRSEWRYILQEKQNRKSKRESLGVYDSVHS
jgi:biotin operon repressor